MRLRRAASRALTAVAAAALTLTLGELGLRRLYPVPPPYASVFDYRVPDPLLGWRLEPGAAIINEKPDFRVTLEINSRGFRDREHPVEKPPDTFRVLVLGDSFMEAYSVALEDAFGRRLERELSARLAPAGLSPEVLNFGVGGYGTYQEYLSIREQGPRYRPDLVLLGFTTSNDVTDNDRELDATIQPPGSLKAETRPFVSLGPEGAWVVRTPAHSQAAARYERERARRWPIRWWEAAADLRARGRRDSPKWWERTVTAHLAASARRPRGETDRALQYGAVLSGLLAGVHACREQPRFTRGWAITEAILDRLNEDVLASGARLAVFTVPAIHEVDASAWRQVAGAAGDPAEYCFDTLPGNRRLEGILRARGVPCIDLVPSFREPDRGGGWRYFRASDRHWNELGHARAATVVAQALAERGLLPRAAKPPR